jgi:hypothetical protein
LTKNDEMAFVPYGVKNGDELQIGLIDDRSERRGGDVHAACEDNPLIN